MKILSVSDEQVGLVYSSQVASRFKGANLVIGCGDLALSYLDYIVSMLNIPLYFVHGNHVPLDDELQHACGTNLHRRTLRDPETGLLLAGIEGSLEYNHGPHQYEQDEMWLWAFGLSLRLMVNKLRYGRALDVLVTHAPPWRIHDENDRPHHGIKAFNWLIQSFQPALHLHGHVHVYRQDTVRETLVGKTRVINTFGYRFTELEVGKKSGILFS
jgi:Icc-related predicted phosphoesterase